MGEAAFDMGDEAAQDVDWETASEEVKKERIKKIFDDLDENKNGKLEKDELVKALGEANAHQCILDCDVDQDGCIDIGEFNKCILGFPPDQFDNGCKFLEAAIKNIQSAE